MTDRPSILVPLRVLEGESIPDGVPELLANAHVVLLGYHVIPDQTAPGQAQMEFEDRANERMDDFQGLLEGAGATVERRLVFTHHAQKTIDRLIYEYDCQAVLVPNATAAVEDVLVAIRGTVGTDVIARVVGGLFAGTETAITLFHAIEEGETEADANTLLDGLKERMIDLGVDADAIETVVADRADPKAAILERAGEHDVAVMGESDPSIATFIFGMRAEQVADRFLGPVLIVQRERPEP